MDKLTELRERLMAKRKQVHEIVERKPDLDWTEEELKAFQDGQKEINDLAEQFEKLHAVQEAAEANRKALETGNQPVYKVSHPGEGDAPQQVQHKDEGKKSIGAQFIESEAYKHFNPRQQMAAGVELEGLGIKATFTTTASTLTQYDRQPGMIMVGLERLTVADLLAEGQTNQNTIRYLREDTYTNAATTVLEEGLKPEATFDTSEADAPVRKIAVIGRVTDEMWNDFPAIRDYIDNRLRFMVAEREEAQLLNGNGTAPNLRGILQTVGIQTQAKGTDPTPDAIYRAMTKVRTIGFMEPSGLVIHPNDWTDVRLLRAADGTYIFGSPFEMGPERIWGMPVVVTTALTEGTGLVGAFRLGAQIFRREGIRVESTNTDGEDFRYNRIAIRVEERLALAVWRPLAFCTVTGI